MFLPRRAASANRPDLLESISKLAIAGERAGLTIEEMIGLLNAGLTVATLIDLIIERLELIGLIESDSPRKEYRV
jgi:hypothetical protein